MFELLSPKLQGKQSFPDLARCINAIFDLNCKSGDNCHFWVNIDCRDWDLLDYKKIVANFIKFEEVFDRFSSLN